MTKILLQLVLLIASFFLCFFLLKQPDWLKIFNVREAKETTEEKLGNLYWKLLQGINEEVTDPERIQLLDSLVTRLCEANDIDRESIKLHLLDKDDINAFALPDRHLVVFTGLIEECENPEELCGVLGHELAHIEKGHIMRKLSREIGFSILIGMTTGNGNPEMIQQAIRVLTSSAYDRKLEREADITGIEYMIKADIDPRSFPAFLFRLSTLEKDLPDQLFWISSHPASEERATDLINYILLQQIDDTTPVLDSMQWQTLQSSRDPF